MTDATIGHNGAPDAEQLTIYVDRIMRLEFERRDAAADIKEILSEAKASGLEPYALRAMVRIKLRDEKQAKKAKDKAEICSVYATALQLDLAL